MIRALIISLLVLTGCSLPSVQEQNAQIIAHKKECEDAGLDFVIGNNGLTGERDAYCTKPGDVTQ